MNVKLDAGAYMPERAHKADAGYDLRTPLDITVPAKGCAIIDTGVHIQIPDGLAGLLVSKSGLNVIYGLTSTGLIDSGYTGQIRVRLDNHSYHPHVFKRGDKVSQIIFIPVITDEDALEQVDSLEETERGNAGFGSTGK